MKNIDRNAINITIGKHMADLRDKFHLSQEEISGVVGVKRNTYKCYEIGDRTPPFQLIRDLANFYKVSTDYFFKDMPQLTLKEQNQLLNYANAVANNKQKYIALDLSNPKSMTDYFKQEEEKIQNRARLRLKNLRIENNKKQEDIANYLKVNSSTYNKYENGKRKLNNDIVKKLADYYNLSVSDILD